METKLKDAILKYLADQKDRNLKPKQIARQLGVSDEEYGSFRTAVKQLRDAGHVVMGAKNALTLPEIGNQVIGYFRRNPRGFGFIIPERPNAHGDLYVSADNVGGAMTGDRVRAKVRRKGKRDGRTIYEGTIDRILQRAENRFVGRLEQTAEMHFVIPEGRKFTQPIVIRDIGAAGPPLGSKVVVEIAEYPKAPGELPAGVIVEELGEPGKLEVETRAVIRAHGLKEDFDEATLEDARRQIDRFEAADFTDSRESLESLTIVTIDPPDARDYDDAISLTRDGDGQVTLGVHIADVSHFVQEGSPLDEEARRRSTSTYFPRRVLPMLPEVLSNGVCSLQEGQPRLTKSAFITYDADAQVVSTRLAETIIRSAQRLTYQQAQDICDGRTGGYGPKVVELVREMRDLAKRIEARRRQAGMLHLDLPEVELILDEQGKVADAVPEDQSYTHTIIEMFMVEANEAVARKLESRDRNFLRRIHPAPDPVDGKEMSAFVQACGYKLPRDMNRYDVQKLLESVRGRPESYAINLAVLKTFQQAEYSPLKVGHYALASDCYCHFTSPIRRYPDLTVHRRVAEYCRGELDGKPPESVPELVSLGENCTAAERRSESAEDELREVLVLQLIADRHLGESFEGVITGVTNFGLFVQWPKFLIEGLIRLENLGDDWWEVHAKKGMVRGESTGRTYRIGDLLEVKITSVDVARRQLDLLPAKQTGSRRTRRRGKAKSSAKSKSKSGKGKKGKKGKDKSGGGGKTGSGKRGR